MVLDHGVDAQAHGVFRHAAIAFGQDGQRLFPGVRFAGGVLAAGSVVPHAVRAQRRRDFYFFFQRFYLRGYAVRQEIRADHVSDDGHLEFFGLRREFGRVFAHFLVRAEFHDFHAFISHAFGRRNYVQNGHAPVAHRLGKAIRTYANPHVDHPPFFSCMCKARKRGTTGWRAFLVLLSL